MLILGIESSCDETGVALVRAEGAAVPTLLSHALHSQIEMHQAYGGVVPELEPRPYSAGAATHENRAGRIGRGVE